MKVTPLEIRQKTFEKGFRGYEKEEVDAYLLTLSAEWEKMQDELRELKSKNDFLEKELLKMREVESSLYKTLKTAEDTGSSLVEQANKSAELLLKEAQMKADILMNDTKYNAKNIIEEAELKAKNMEEEAKDHVRIIKRETQEIETIKENLLYELKNIGTDIIEKVQKIQQKEKLKYAQNQSTNIEKKQVASNELIDVEPKTQERNSPKASFFDSL